MKIKRGIILAAAGLLLSGCSGGLFSGARFGSDFDYQELSKDEATSEAVQNESKAHYHFLLGELALEHEDPETARKEFTQAAALETAAAPFLRYRLAELLVRDGKLKEALEETDRGLSAAPNDLNLLQLKAGVLSNMDDTKSAEAVYQKILTLKPDQEEVYVLLASFHAQHGDVEKAIGTLQKLIKQKPDSFFGHYSLGRIYEVANQTKDAEREYKKAIELSRGADSIRLDYARFLGGQKRFKEAIAVTDKIIDEAPDDTNARNLRGQLLLHEDRVDDALKEFEQLQDLEGDPTATRMKIAVIKLERRDFEGALVQLNLIAAAQPQNDEVHYYIGAALSGLGRNDEATKELERVTSENKQQYVRARMLAAYLHQQNHELQQSISLLEAARQAAPKDRQVLSYLASLLKEVGDERAAIKVSRELTELAPNDDRYMFGLAALLHDSGEMDEAVEKLKETIRLNPKNAAALNYLGYSYVEQNKNLDEAQTLIKRALKIEPENGYYLDSLGWIYFLKGDYKEAARYLDAAVKNVPHDAVLLEHRGKIETALGNSDAALKIYQQALQYAPESDDKEVESRLHKLIGELGGSDAARGDNH